MNDLSPAAVLAAAERALRTWGCVALCQITRAEGSTPGKTGWKMLVLPDGSGMGNLGGGAFEALVQADALALLRAASPQSANKRYYLTEKAVHGEATGMVCGGMAEVFLEALVASPLLLVCGGGPVGQAVAAAGRLAGFDLLVADDRAGFLQPGLFPERTEMVQVSREYEEDFLGPWGRREIYAAVVSRCWETDTAALAAVLRQAPADLRYLGLMGSRRKIERVKKELSARGVRLAPGRLHAPIGLSLGGDTPGEIAISILAEVLQVRHQGVAAEERASA